MTMKANTIKSKSTNVNANDDVEESNSQSQWVNRFSSSSSNSSSGSSNKSSGSHNSSEYDDDDNDDESSSWDSTSSDSDDDESSNDDEEEYVSRSFLFQSGIRFRRQKTNNNNNNNIEQSASFSSDNTTNNNKIGKNNRSRYYLHSGNINRIRNYKNRLRQYMKMTKKSTLFLILSVLIWIHVHFLMNKNSHSANTTLYNDDEIIKSLRLKYGSSIDLSTIEKQQRQQSHRKRSSRDKNEASDRFPKDCEAYSWQTYSFPNCNDVHEIDLRFALHMSRRGDVIPADLGEGDKSEHRWSHQDKERARKFFGYLGSGMWRQVWKVNPRIHGEDAVLKVMKSEHSFDKRNFDRHRRDGLVMERLTSSQHVVSIYGFCGNTVLTQHGGMTLDEYLFDDEVQQSNKYNRNTSEGKLRLALEVMKGLQALHDIQDGPIIHADIQAKQFLIDPDDGVKINDFNRCRILPKNNSTGEICKLKIPRYVVCP